MNTIELLKQKRQALLAQINQIKEFRPGNLINYPVKCGKPSCHCAKKDDPAHPSWQLTRKVNGKTVTRRIPKDFVEITSQQVDEHERFKTLIDEFKEVNESLCHLHLQSERSKKKTLKTTQT